ncbi:acyltransferase family protein [Sphingobacterium siyangense]|uniref:acyltransferase family protein n=1 Tax=Sphingobacterium siyangense TaxID=459529 RepID=UPI002FDD7F1C
MGRDYHFKATGTDLLSKTIDFLRFPLIVGVVFVHTDFSNIVMAGVKQFSFVDLPFFARVFFMFFKVIFGVRVPLFFFIAVFLFFYRTEGFSLKIYCKKLKNRVHSLLIPYIFWNLAVLFFLFLAQTFLSGSLVSGENKLMINYSLSDWLWSFWDTSQINHHAEKSLPVNSPFWFIRDLIVVVLLSPLVYFLIKKIGIMAVVLLGLLWCYSPYFYFPGMSTVSFFFFAAGAYFSVYKMDFVVLMRRLLPCAVGFFALLIAAEFYFLGKSWWNYLYCANVIVGLVLVVAITAHFIQKGSWRPNSFLAKGSFFIFAYHRLPLVFVIKFLFNLIHPQSEVALICLYFACPTIVIVLGLLGYRLLKNMFPRFTAVICGGR